MKPKTNKTNKTETLAVFCEDGSYSSGGFAVLDVSNFTASDWTDLNESSDSDRLHLALSIAKKRNRKK